MSSDWEKLPNLPKIGQLKASLSAESESSGLIRAAENRLRDAQNKSNSVDSRFSLAYDAAYSLALAALRKQGYRSENRFIVFKLLRIEKGVTLRPHPRSLHPSRGCCTESPR